MGLPVGLDDDIAILSATPLVGFMGRDALRLLSFAAERRTLAAGERLFAHGESAEGGFVVMSGALTLTPRGTHAAPVTVGRSGLIGRLALFQRGERPCDADASSTSEVVRITPTLMRRVLVEFPDAARAIHGELTTDLAAFAADLVGMSTRFDTISSRDGTIFS